MYIFFFRYLKSNIEIVVNLSTSTKKLYLDINKIHGELGAELCLALAICHIFTGNDYNPSFYRKGKKRPFNILKKNVKFQKCFNYLLNIHDSELTTDSEAFKNVEEFLCRMYNLKTNDVNEGRFEIFQKNYKSRSENEPVLKKKLSDMMRQTSHLANESCCNI